MAVERGCRNTQPGDTVIEKEIQTVLKHYRETTAPEDFKKNLKESFKKVREAVTDDALIACDAWPCEFCSEIFSGRDYDEAGVIECDSCCNIVCDSCAQTHLKKKGKAVICSACE